MMKAAIQRATECGQPIYVNPEPKIIDDAVANLEAFAGDCLVEECPARLNREPLDVNTKIIDCFGWTQLPRGDVFTALSHASKRRDQFPQEGRAYADLDENESCFAIVYSFVPEEKLDADVVQRQLDFFHVAGFNLAPFRERNWRGEGILVDISDLIPPHGRGWWRQGDYQRMNVRGYISDLEERYVRAERTLISKELTYCEGRRPCGENSRKCNRSKRKRPSDIRDYQAANDTFISCASCPIY